MSDNEYGDGQGASYAVNQSYGQNTNINYGTAPAPAQAAPPPAPQYAPSQAHDGKPHPIKDISSAEFATEVMEASMSTPVIVDFWAPWCEPCKQLTPLLEAAVNATKGRMHLVKMNIEEHPEIATQLQVKSIPAVYAFAGGKPVDGFMGMKSKPEIDAFINKLLPEDPAEKIKVLLEEANELTKQGAFDEAANIYTQVLAFQPDNLDAMAGMGLLLLEQDNLEGAKAVLEELEPDAVNNLAISALKSAIELKEQVAGLGDLDELKKSVDENPQDHQARIDLALALNGANKREEAAEHLLEIIKQDPSWNDEAAKNQLLQFFEIWGITDKSTISARRKLSSILFS